MKKQFLALVMALTMLLSLPMATTAQALDVSEDTTHVVTVDEFVPLEESGISMDYALELLGLSAEEAEGLQFYANVTSTASPRADVTVSSGEEKDIDTLQITAGASQNTQYGNIVTINGTRLAAGCGVVYANNSTATCSARLKYYNYPHKTIFHYVLDRSNNQSTQGFVNIERGERVQFEFNCPAGASVYFLTVITVGG